MKDVSRLHVLLSAGFRQLEIGFWEESSLPSVMDFCRREELSYGFHHPLPKPSSFDYPFLTDPDEDRRRTTLASIRRTLDTATEYAALYVVAHLPSVIFHPLPEMDEARIVALAHDSCAQLASWSEASGIPIVLENVGPNPYFHRAQDFLNILEAYPALRFCLDIGHLHLTTFHSGIDPYEFAAQLSPYTWLIHIYNATLEMYRRYHHVPVHPSQRPEEGWADVEGLLERALAGTRTCTIVFEHTPQYPASETFVKEGIDWVRELVSRYLG
jgi:sugar phosphate isomerase/epimerase